MAIDEVVARRSRGNLEILRSAQNDTSCQIAELVLSVSEGSLYSSQRQLKRLFQRLLSIYI